MAKKSNTVALPISINTLLIILMAVVMGFVIGFFFAKQRYLSKITTISQMHMQKAVEIDDLKAQIQVLGAATEEKE